MRLVRLIFILLPLLALADLAWAEVAVRAVVDAQEVVVGEGLTLQVQVEGSDSPQEPDLRGLADFVVEARGGQQNSSESVSIVNGRMERVSRRGYVFNYTLIPKREGRLLIPALTVRVEGRDQQTQPIPILVSQPKESEDFKLRLSLDKERAYVGEPLLLSVTWYIGRDVKGFNFNLPILSDPRFALGDSPTAGGNRPPDSVVRIPTPGGEVLAQKSQGTLDGKDYLTVSFTQPLIPREAGRLTLPQGTVSCQVAAGQGQGRAFDPFADDFFGRGRQAYRTVVAPSNQPVVEVLPLPEEGRPADFTGLVGAYSLAVSATPTTVKVGDPITLSIQVAGPLVAGLVLPSLAQQLGEADFKVPEDMAPGQGGAELKTFTQTVRARHAGVAQIPSLTLPFFNPVSGRYESARSQSVPLTVAETRTVTAKDAEGASGAAPAKALKSASGGINFNYEGPELLTVQTAAGDLALTPLWYMLLLLPPAGFGLSLLLRLLGRGHRDAPARRAARQAQSVLWGELARIAALVGSDREGHAALGQALRDYLGGRLGRNPAALTYADVESDLRRGGVSPTCLARLREVMESCEAAKYAGPALDPADLGRLVELARLAAQELG